MVLTGSLARWAARRPHVLLAAAPGATEARVAVEAEVASVGGVVADSPADADVLAVVGRPGRELGGAVEGVWAQLPGPRVRADVDEPGQAVPALARAVAALCELERVAVAGARHDEWGGPDSGHGGASGHGHADETGNHGGHGGGMSMPGGLMMADRGPDRDGLTLDVLRVPFGPVLADWPAGLVVELMLQGDLVQSVQARVLAPAEPVAAPFWTGGEGEAGRRRGAAGRLDSLGRLLAVAGWASMAWRVRRLRDGLLGELPAGDARAELAGIDRRMRRSRALRLATDGLGVLTGDLAGELADTAAEHGVAGLAADSVLSGGDATARWLGWLAETDQLLAEDRVDADNGARDGGGWTGAGRSASRVRLAAAQRLMVGVDVAAARLVLASFDPDPDELVAEPARAPA